MEKMMTMEQQIALNPLPSNGLVPFEAIERAKAYGRAARAPRTRVEYARDFEDFTAWCVLNGLDPLPAEPQTVALYASDQAARGRKISTIRRRMVAISQRHLELGLESPCRHQIVREVLTGIARTHGSSQRRVDALGAELLPTLLLNTRQHTLRGLRDRALVLICFAGAFRRSEIAALEVADLAFDARGLAVTLKKSKTDQAKEGRVVAIPFVPTIALCPVRALQAWLHEAGITAGPVFRSFGLPQGRKDATERLQERALSGRDVSRVVQGLTGRAGLEGVFTAHSLRAGFVTSAARQRVPEVDIARVTGHRSTEILRRYVRRATLFEDAPLSSILG